jgi:hypothetical protein
VLRGATPPPNPGELQLSSPSGSWCGYVKGATQPPNPGELQPLLSAHRKYTHRRSRPKDVLYHRAAADLPQNAPRMPAKFVPLNPVLLWAFAFSASPKSMWQRRVQLFVRSSRDVSERYVNVAEGAKRSIAERFRHKQQEESPSQVSTMRSC